MPAFKKTFDILEDSCGIHQSPALDEGDCVGVAEPLDKEIDELIADDEGLLFG